MVHEPSGMEPGATVALLDCGVKYGILRRLLSLGFRAIGYRTTPRPTSSWTERVEQC